MNTRTLTNGQRGVLSAAAAVMVAVGVAGAIGTYSNALTEFGRQATAAGVVAAGEGLTLILALTMVGLTLLGQSAPVWVRVGLWLAPLAACGTGLALADNITEAVVYSVMPLGMSGAAEGLGLISRRIVIYTTGVDAEAQRRNAATLQRLAYHRARAANHPGKWTQRWSERAAWRLAKAAGVGDPELGADLVGVQRARLTTAGDDALRDMFTVAPAPTVPELPQVTLERLDDDQAPAALESRPRPAVVPAGVRLLPIVARPTGQDATQDAEDTQDAPASPSVPPFPLPVPAGVRLLPIVARPKAPTPTGQDAQDAPQDTEDAQDGPPPEPPLMTSADVARHYGIEQSTVRSWVAAGRIPVHGKDARGRNLFHPDDLPAHQVGVPV
ncbi:helix-turn-helix domain-containing protein [Streptomyces sp. YIM B13518]|uniref:helix-turn-helix domain-containing protein n=1 Tax=Streptomyces sp. YIM B13518 TaxID=3366316 RepID=UPI00369734DF